MASEFFNNFNNKSRWIQLFWPFLESGNTNNYVALVEMDDGTSVIMGFVHGLGPNPLHGFHIHEFGDLSDGCASVGDSFYDLGNIAADPGGNSVILITDTVKLTGDAEDSVAGRSIVIYENAGDLGARLKCCNIRVDYIPPN